MICPKNPNYDFDVDNCISCEHYSECMAHSGFNACGDNYPSSFKNSNSSIPKKENYSLIEQEMISTINWLGHSGTWLSIEAIKDPIMRLKYRRIFLKVGGKIPEGDINDL